MCRFSRHTEPIGEVSINAAGVVSFCQNEMDSSHDTKVSIQNDGKSRCYVT
ncbi:MAG: hypothetical protein IJS88_04175 [Alphaproteobacteria bacterium]|nr:hypothetical protein [Alphaproteobacteria bacterium]